MKKLLYAIGIIIAIVVMLVIVIPLDIIDEIKWRLSK